MRVGASSPFVDDVDAFVVVEVHLLNSTVGAMSDPLLAALSAVSVIPRDVVGVYRVDTVPAEGARFA